MAWKLSVMFLYGACQGKKKKKINKGKLAEVEVRDNSSELYSAVAG
jgi:hypothetical protein